MPEAAKFFTAMAALAAFGGVLALTGSTTPGWALIGYVAARIAYVGYVKFIND